MLDKNLVKAELDSIFLDMNQMYNKKLAKEELNKIFQLILASIDPEYLIQLTTQKMADGKFGMDSKQFQKNNWNRVIPALVEKNNEKNKGKAEIKISPANFDFYDFVYKQLAGSRGGESQAEAEDATNKILYKIFLPEISAALDREVKEEFEEDGELSTNKGEKSKSTQELQEFLDVSKKGLINHFRTTLESGKTDEKFSFTTSFKSTANTAVADWFRQITKLRKKVVQPKWNKEKDEDSLDNKEDKSVKPVDEDLFSKQFNEQMEEDEIDNSILTILEDKVNKDLWEFLDEEKKEGLLSTNAYKTIEYFTDIKEEDNTKKRDKVIKHLGLVPDNYEKSESKDSLVKGAIKKYKEIIDEIKYALARYAYEYENDRMLSVMKRKDPEGRILLPSDANATYNPYQKKFVKKDLDKITKFLDDNYDKNYATLKKEFSKWFASKLVKQLDEIYAEQGSVEKMLEFLENYKKTGKSLSDYEGKNKKSSERIASIVSYLEELMSRIEG